jgi:peptidoglycan/xylan/chitin deacetylase (PgdA/CDA1 family)
MYTGSIMGAPVREWFVRAAVACAAAAATVVLLRQPWPPAVKMVALALLTLSAVWLAFRIIPSFDPLGRVSWRLPRARQKYCALTFDDGPSPATGAVLDILAAERVPATFFVLGVNAEQHPEMVRRAHAEGHAVGIHGMTHARLAGASEAIVAGQIANATGVLTRIGVAPAPVYRTPHGFKSRGVFAVVRRRGLTLWAWSRGVWDTDRPAPEVLVRRATRLARSRMVLLLHDGRGQEPRPDVGPMLAALPEIIRELKRRGFAFVRVADFPSRV